MIRAVLLDADNTLYPTRGIARAADREALRFLAGKSKTPVAALLREWTAIVAGLMHSKKPGLRTRKHSYRLLAGKHRIRGHSTAYSLFASALLKRLKPFPGTARSLARLRKRGYKLAVFTEDSRELALRKLRKSGLARYFDAVVTSDDVRQMKPSPLYYMKAAAMLGVPPKHCLVVGDSHALDLEPAKRLGMPVLLAGKGRGIAPCLGTRGKSLP